MNDLRDALLVLAGFGLIIFFVVFNMAYIAPGIMIGFLYLVGVQKLFGFKAGSSASFMHLIIAAAIALSLIVYLIKAAPWYRKYFAMASDLTWVLC